MSIMRSTSSFLLLLLLFVSALSCALASPQADHPGVAALKRLHEQRALEAMFKWFPNLHLPFPFKGKEGADLECTLCSVAVSEVYGMLNENLTETEIEKTVRDDVCSHLSDTLKVLCDDLADDLPIVYKAFESRQTIADVCENELKLCTSDPNPPHADPVPAPFYEVNLDLEPSKRWQGLWGAEPYKSLANELVDFFKNFTDPARMHDVELLGSLILDILPQEYADEVRGGAEAMGISPGFLGFMQVSYTVSDLCTSISSVSSDNQIYHSRNLDFGLGVGFTKILRRMSAQVNFTRGGKTVYRGAAYAGFAGLLSAHVGGGWAATINTRWYQGHWWDWLVGSILDWVEHPTATLPSLLLRDVAATKATWTDAVEELKTAPLVSPVYFTVSGTSAANNEGCVIARNQNDVHSFRQLDVANGVFYVLITNYDWVSDSGKPLNAPWFDDRRYEAELMMNQTGRAGIDFDHLLNNVMSAKPVLNRMTTYTFLSKPVDDDMSLYHRWCNAPCPE